MELLSELRLPLPQHYRPMAGFTFNRQICSLLQSAPDGPDTINEIRRIVQSAQKLGVPLDDNSISFFTTDAVRILGQRLMRDPGETFIVERLTDYVILEKELPFVVDFWELQNTFHYLLDLAYPFQLSQANSGDHRCQGWVAAFRKLGSELRIRVDR